jgi:hypothetical protein
LQQRLVKTGGRLVKHARYWWLLLAESHLTRRLFGSMMRANLGATAACGIEKPPAGRRIHQPRGEGGKEVSEKSLRAAEVPGGKGHREPFRRLLEASWMEPETDRSKTRQCVLYWGAEVPKGNSGLKLSAGSLESYAGEGTSQKKETNMAGNKLTIKLTDDQQKQIRDATGRTIAEINIDPAATGLLSDNALEDVAGGAAVFTFGEKVKLP